MECLPKNPRMRMAVIPRYFDTHVSRYLITIWRILNSAYPIGYHLAGKVCVCIIAKLSWSQSLEASICLIRISLLLRVLLVIVLPVFRACCRAWEIVTSISRSATACVRLLWFMAEKHHAKKALTEEPDPSGCVPSFTAQQNTFAFQNLLPCFSGQVFSIMLVRLGFKP